MYNKIKNRDVSLIAWLLKNDWGVFVENEEIQKGEDEMNACAMKPKLPYVTRNTLSRTPASEDNKKIAEFINSHDFSLDVDSTGKFTCVVTNKGK